VLWFIKDRSYEPLTVLLATLLSLSSVIRQRRKEFKNRTTNELYKINVRGPEQNIQEFTELLIQNEPAIIKWKIYNSADDWKDVIIETSAKLDVNQIKKMTIGKCKLYEIRLNDEVIYGCEV
jgi:hypothetical protein